LKHDRKNPGGKEANQLNQVHVENDYQTSMCVPVRMRLHGFLNTISTLNPYQYVKIKSTEHCYCHCWLAFYWDSISTITTD